MAKCSRRSAKEQAAGFDLTMSCKFCGKPITVSNKYGMFCEDLCNMGAEKQAYAELRSFMVSIGVMTAEQETEDSKND